MKYKNNYLFSLIFISLFWSYDAFAQQTWSITGPNFPCDGDEMDYTILGTSYLPNCGNARCTTMFGDVTDPPEFEITWEAINGTIIPNTNHPNDPLHVRVQWHGCQGIGVLKCRVKCKKWVKRVDLLDDTQWDCVLTTSDEEIRQKSVNILCTADFITSVPSILKRPCCVIDDPNLGPKLNLDFIVPNKAFTVLRLFNSQEVIEPEVITTNPHQDFINLDVRYSFYYSQLVVGSRYVLTVQNPCNGQITTHNIDVIAEENFTTTSPNLPYSLCTGQSHNLCVSFQRPECMDFEYDITYEDENGNVTVPKQTTSVSNGNGLDNAPSFCFQVTSSPNPTAGNKQRMKINFRYKPRCATAWNIESWTIPTPVQAPSNFALNSSNSNIPNPFCICNAFAEINAPSDEGTSSVDWEIINGTTTSAFSTSVGQLFSTNLCDTWLNINQDVTIRWRRTNACGSSSWNQVVIPASQLRPQNHPDCN